MKKGHLGVYGVLNELRRNFYIQSHFSTIKGAIRSCTKCQRVNGRTIQTNQNAYKEWRISPPNIPYRAIFVDHFGSYEVKINGKKTKVYVLLISCLWSRAVNLKLCLDMSTGQYLKALQSHIFTHGTPSKIASDQGSSIIAGGNVINSMISNSEVEKFLLENSIEGIDISQYPTGKNSLGSLVESMVKCAKRMLNGLVGKQVMDVFDFILLLEQAVCIINKRPICFKDDLRENSTQNELLTPITPECILRGHDLTTINILPSREVDMDAEWLPEKDSEMFIKDNLAKLNQNRQKLADIYQDEFLGELMHLATNKKGRYTKVKHVKLEVGDICLIKEPMQKAVNFPMGIVTAVTTNSIGEVTDVVLRKGNKEKIRRHVNSVVFLLKGDPSVIKETQDKPNIMQDQPKSLRTRHKRQASTRANVAMQRLSEEDLV